MMRVREIYCNCVNTILPWTDIVIFSCEHDNERSGEGGNEHSDFIKCGAFLHHMSDYWLNKDSDNDVTPDNAALTGFCKHGNELPVCVIDETFTR
jgi:hypothetical protein